MSIYTLNNLIKLFEDIAEAHYQIKYFGFGELWEVDGVTAKKMENYPVLWVVPTGATQEENTTVFTFDVLCFDNVENDESNENEVLSDTIQILQDVVRIIRENSDDYEIDSFNNIYLPFTEKFNSRCTGWTASLGIRVDFDFTNCDIPASDFTSEGTSCLPVYIYDINGNLVDTIESGGSYTCDTSGGGDVTVTNSDASYTQTVTCGDTLELPDTTYNVYIDGVLEGTGTVVTLKNETINIVWQ